mmetsp:Transcript_40290/g.38761  ORF Transcript_40290/g.38761 Transcript_40290/m.38761 type:complete len:81 (-) Transcript_40290:478-720(-)
MLKMERFSSLSLFLLLLWLYVLVLLILRIIFEGCGQAVLYFINVYSLKTFLLLEILDLLDPLWNCLVISNAKIFVFYRHQ